MRVTTPVRAKRWSTLVLLLFGVLVGTALTDLASQPDVVEAADAAPSYELFDFEIQYPYVDPRDQYADEPVDRSNLAGVSYASRWAGSTYPGMAKCQIVLRGGTGDVVGRVDFEVTSGMPQTPPTDFWPQIEVSAPPLSASGSCANSVYPAGSGYAFERPDISRPMDRDTGQPDTSKSKLSFPSRWTTASNPGIRTCDVIVRFEDGGRHVYGPLNVHLPEGEPLVIEPPIADPQSIRDAHVECTELQV